MKSPRMNVQAIPLAVLAATVAAIGLTSIDGANAVGGGPFPIPSGSPSPKPVATKKTDEKKVKKSVGGLDENLLAKAGKGGSNVGGTNRASGDLSSITAWCRGSVGILNMARQVVGASLLNSDYATAIATYRAGIVKAILQAEENNLDGSLTLNALRRALAVGDDLYAGLIGAEDREVRVTDYYNTSYDFLVKVADEIDIPLYIPYVRSNRRFDPLQHESQFAKYGVAQLEWLMGNFVYETAEQYYAQFNSTIYLKLAENLTAGVAEDLSQSVFANAYACQVQDLEILSQLLAKHNAGDRTIYGGRDKYAVNSSAFAIRQVIKKLHAGCARSTF